MSRRREAHDLERVLALSKEEAQRPAERATTPMPSEAEAPRASLDESADAPRPQAPGRTHARKRFFGKPIRTLLVSDKTSRMPGLGRRVRLPPLHPHRRSPPPKRPRLPAKETPASKGEVDDDEDDREREPEPDYENEGFL